MRVFKGIPPGQKIDLSGILTPKPSVMCTECKRKFKEWMKSGGLNPIPCEACKQRLKDKMYDGTYPDRTTKKKG